MTTIHETLSELLTIDFARVCAELDSARLMVELKDTTAHRAAVSYCEQAVDAVLDMFLLVGRPPALRRPERPAPAVAPEPLTAAT